MTLLSLERYGAYEPGRELSESSAPLLMITADDDAVTPTDLTDEAVRNARRDIERLSVPGGHYAVYSDHRERCAHAAARFLATHLRARGSHTQEE